MRIENSENFNAKLTPAKGPRLAGTSQLYTSDDITKVQILYFTYEQTETCVQWQHSPELENAPASQLGGFSRALHFHSHALSLACSHSHSTHGTNQPTGNHSGRVRKSKDGTSRESRRGEEFSAETAAKKEKRERGTCACAALVIWRCTMFVHPSYANFPFWRHPRNRITCTLPARGWLGGYFQNLIGSSVCSRVSKVKIT